jgi:hypothetical protein
VAAAAADAAAAAVAAAAPWWPSRHAPRVRDSVQPNLDSTGEYYGRECTDGWFIGAGDGSLYGNGKWGKNRAGGVDRVGMLLDARP